MNRIELFMPHERLPDTRPAFTHKLKVGGSKAYLTVGIYEDGRPGEVFIKCDKSEYNGWTSALSIVMSLALQHGVPLRDITEKLAHIRFEPSGPTSNPEIPMAASLVDYIARYLETRFEH